MVHYILISVISFLTGFLISALIFKKKNNDALFYNLINDLKRTIEEYKNQNILNTNEISNSLKSASELAKVLTTNQNLKGKFGEDCLENIIKACYPQNNINYIKQYNSQNEDDKNIKPDYLIKLPNDKCVLIDCKLNLEKYIEYTNDKTSEAKKIEFMHDINTTVNNLSNKKYQTAKGINQPDFILMYIPLETVLTTIYTDKDFLGIIKNANEKNIIIVGNSSILTTLRLIKTLWAQDKQEKNVDEIVNCAQKLYDFIARHSQNLYDIKQQLEKSYGDFNREYEKMTSNKFFNIIEQLRNFGIEAKEAKNGKKLEQVEINKDFLN